MLFRELVFYVSTAYGFAREVFCNHAWYTRLDSRLLLGALPLKSFWDQVEATEGITHIVCMLEPFEVKPFIIGPNDAAQRGLKYLSLPVQDFVAVPTLEQVKQGIKFIESSVSEAHTNIYIHCKAGRTRSAFLVACYFVHQEQISADLAIEKIRSRRPHIRFSATQLSTLRQFADKLLEQSSPAD